MRRTSIILLAGLAACGGGSPRSDPPPPSSVPPAQALTVEATRPVPDDIDPGTVDSRTIVVSDGTEIIYGLILPDGFDPSEEYPVLLALPPGAQDAGLTLSLAESTYAPEALARGWVVITPAAPGGRLFFDGSERYLTEILGLHDWIRPEGGRYHLAGISNGGVSAFRIAGLEPDRFASIAVYPGFPRAPSDKDALPSLVGIPIAMFVGGDDSGWITPMEETRATLDELGGDVSLDIREGEQHVMRSMADGVDLFDFFDSHRG